MNSLNFEFFRYAGSSQSKKSSCNISGAATRKRAFISKVLSQRGHCFTERDLLEVQIVISLLIFEILKNGFQFSTPLIALF